MVSPGFLRSGSSTDDWLVVAAGDKLTSREFGDDWDKKGEDKKDKGKKDA